MLGSASSELADLSSAAPPPAAGVWASVPPSQRSWASRIASSQPTPPVATGFGSGEETEKQRRRRKVLHWQEFSGLSGPNPRHDNLASGMLSTHPRDFS